MRLCAYCGKHVQKREREHVIPRCLYPPSKAGSNVQRLTVSACRQCNQSWADDEAHFRNMLVLAGESNKPVQELWEGKMLPSFDKVDGRRRIIDLVSRFKPVKTQDGVRSAIYPGQDERFMRIVRKIVRGLSYHHRIIWPLSDHRVWADVFKYVTPPGFLEGMEYHHREPDIFSYHYQVLHFEDIHSAWLLTIFERRKFIALVSESEEGFSGK